MTARVVIAGHLTIDDIHLPDGRLLPATVGGAAAYATAGAVMYGADVTLFTLLGEDYPFQAFVESVSLWGQIDDSHVRVAAPRSIHNDAWYMPNGIRRFDVESWKVMEELTPTAADFDEDEVLGGHVLLTAGSLEKQRETAAALRRRGCQVTVDTEIHYFSTPELKRVLGKVVGEANYFLPSIEHLQVLHGRTSRDAAAYTTSLATMGCRWIVLKRGAEGSTLLDCGKSRLWQIPSVMNIEVVDPTGAGDAFAGGFVAALADGKEPLCAACWGTVSASFEIETIGAGVPESFSRGDAQWRYDQICAGIQEGTW